MRNGFKFFAILSLLSFMMVGKIPKESSETQIGLAACKGAYAWACWGFAPPPHTVDFGEVSARIDHKFADGLHIGVTGNFINKRSEYIYTLECWSASFWYINPYIARDSELYGLGVDLGVGLVAGPGGFFPNGYLRLGSANAFHFSVHFYDNWPALYTGIFRFGFGYRLSKSIWLWGGLGILPYETLAPTIFLKKGLGKNFIFNIGGRYTFRHTCGFDGEPCIHGPDYCFVMGIIYRLKHRK